MKVRELLYRFLIWRMKHISNRHFVLILAGVVGAFAGLAAVVLKETVHFIQLFLTSGFDTKYENYYYLGYPLIGIVLTVIVARYILKEKLGHGITSILFHTSKLSSIIPRSKMYSRMITSAITVGFGGSVGLEAPIAVTGSAIGSNFGRLFHLNYNKRTLLIGCGAAGAISAIFNSPIAGVIFSVEVILANVTITSLVPLLIASVCASLVSRMLVGNDFLFLFKIQDQFVASDVPYFLLLGVTCGLVAVYFTRLMYFFEDLIQRVNNKIGRAVLGGVSLGLIIFIFPPIYGEGYQSILNLLQGKEETMLNNTFFFEHVENNLVIMLFLLGIILVKPIATALTIGSGGSGGVFAPSLFLGGVTGYLFSRVINVFGPGGISTSNFTLVAMCGVMSGVLHAPLTAIFLIAEITGGYTLFVPLMLVSAIAYTTSLYFESDSLYTKKLIQRGDLIRDRDKQVLSLIDLKKIVETDLSIVSPQATLGELVDLVRKSKRNIFPVVNEHNELLGIITLDDIREKMFDEESRNSIIVSTIMHSPPSYVSPKESMESVMLKFEKTSAWNLPVIEEGKYVGFLSKSRIFNAYRKKLIRQHKE